MLSPAVLAIGALVAAEPIWLIAIATGLVLGQLAIRRESDWMINLWLVWQVALAGLAIHFALASLVATLSAVAAWDLAAFRNRFKGYVVPDDLESAHDRKLLAALTVGGSLGALAAISRLEIGFTTGFGLALLVLLSVALLASLGVRFARHTA